MFIQGTKHWCISYLSTLAEAFLIGKENKIVIFTL
jgi:hypothetical protein